MKILTLCAGITLLCNPSAFAKGLDSLKPDTNKEQPSMKIRAAEPAKPQPTSKPQTPSTSRTTAPQKAATTTQQGGKASAAVKKADMPSAISQKLKNRLGLSSSLGYAAILDAGDADFEGGPAADITLFWRYLVRDTLMAAASLRYAPVNFTGTLGDTSYRGVIEGVYLGSSVTWQRKSIAWLAGGELGYLSVSAKTHDSLEQEDKPEDGAVAFSAFTGLDWAAKDSSLRVGPRVYGIFGTYQMAQMAVAASFVF